MKLKYQEQQFLLKKKNEEYAKLLLVDLAGSERAAETQSNNKSRIAEGAAYERGLRGVC